MMCCASSVWANVITFSGGSAEDGFFYRLISGVLVKDFDVGNPTPSLTAGNPGPFPCGSFVFPPCTGGGTLSVTRSGGGGFTFLGIDIEEADGGIGGAPLDQIVVTGFLRGQQLGSITLTPIQATMDNPIGPWSHADAGSLSGMVFDEIQIHVPAFTFGVAGAAGSIDNVSLAFAELPPPPDPPAAPAPEPAAVVLTGAGLALGLGRIAVASRRR
jgi:hypothetical protein